VSARCWRRSSIDRVRLSAIAEELSEFRLSDPRVAAGVPDQSVEEGWLGERGATENQIRAMEQRLGQSMPPSYRSFLAAPNGFWLHRSSIKRLYGTNGADWFSVRHGAWADAYREMYPHLPSCLQISEVVGDGAVLLLERDAGSTDVESRTYYFANWIPGGDHIWLLSGVYGGRAERMR